NYAYFSTRVEPLGPRIALSKTQHATRGFVVPMFDAMIPIGVSLIQELRRYGNNDVIQVYHCLGELSPLSMQLLHRADDFIEVIDVCHEYVTQGNLTLEQAKDFRNFYIKPLALIHTRLEDVILLDADDILFSDPAALWDVPAYKATGTIFFYDREINENSYLNGKHRWTNDAGVDVEENTLREMVRMFESERFGLRRNQPSDHVRNSLPFNSQGAHEQDSSVVVVDKRRHHIAMDVLWFLITAWRYRFTYSWGDKENFWLAYELSQSPYSFSPHGTSAAGGRQGHDVQTVCGDIAHFFPLDGRDDILHINGNKLINPYTKIDAVNGYDHSFQASKLTDLVANLPGYFAGLRRRGPTPIMQPNSSCPQECMYQRGAIAVTNAQRQSMVQRISDTFEVAAAVDRHVVVQQGVVLPIVTDADAARAVSSINQLRRVGYQGWVQVYHCAGNFPSHVLQTFVRIDAYVQVVDACQGFILNGNLTMDQIPDFQNSYLAPLALIHTSMSHVVVLNVHAVVLQDPTAVLWSDVLYSETGTVFFHDHHDATSKSFLNHPATYIDERGRSVAGTALEAVVHTFNYSKFNLDGPRTLSPSLKASRAWNHQSASRQDGSLFAVDKSRADKAMQVLWELITTTRFQHGYSKGAKENVWLAYELSQLPYAFSKFGASYVDGASPWTAQYGPAKDDELLVVMTALSDVASIDDLPANVCRRRLEGTTDDATCLDQHNEGAQRLTSSQVQALKVRAVSEAVAAVVPKVTHDKRNLALRVVVGTLHVATTVYLVVWVLIMLFSSGPNVVTAKFYQPKVTAAGYTMISLMHVGALMVPNLCHRKPAVTSLWKPLQPPPPPVTVRRLSSKTQSRIIVRQLSKRAATDWFDHVFIVFNFIVILCQGRQAYEMLSTMVDPTKVVSYAAIVLLYSVLSPCLVFINNIQTKYTLVCYADALFSFTLSCGHPMFSVAIQALELIVVNPNLVRNNRWSAETLLFARLFGVTGPVDFFVKHVMHLSTYFTICRLANTAHLADSNKDQSSDLQRNHQNRVMRRLNLGVSSGLGVVCAILLGRCLLYREPCPSYCLSKMQPLMDLGCHCAYVNINCHTLGIDDPTPLLDPRIIGTRLVYVQFSRCDLENGLNATSMVPFQQITKIQVTFSNMSSWTGPLPASLNNILVQYSRLETIPHALLYDIPPELVTILIDAAPLKTIPDIAFNAWSFVQRLQLLNVSLTTFPNGILSMPHLTELNLRGNNITSMLGWEWA
ncbi:hypothetical protein DYB35_010061, partial [Aphanomyces astaci]